MLLGLTVFTLLKLWSVRVGRGQNGEESGNEVGIRKDMDCVWNNGLFSKIDPKTYRSHKT